MGLADAVGVYALERELAAGLAVEHDINYPHSAATQLAHDQEAVVDDGAHGPVPGRRGPKLIWGCTGRV